MLKRLIVVGRTLTLVVPRQHASELMRPNARRHGAVLKLLIMAVRGLALMPCGHRDFVLENVALRQQSRTHRAIGKGAPDPRPVSPPSAASIIAIPEVGGLHYRYERHAA